MAWSHSAGLLACRRPKGRSSGLQGPVEDLDSRQTGRRAGWLWRRPRAGVAESPERRFAREEHVLFERSADWWEAEGTVLKNAHVQDPWLYFLCGPNITTKNNRTARSIAEVIFIVYSLQITFSEMLNQLVLMLKSLEVHERSCAFRTVLFSI